MSTFTGRSGVTRSATRWRATAASWRVFAGNRIAENFLGASPDGQWVVDRVQRGDGGEWQVFVCAQAGGLVADSRRGRQSGLRGVRSMRTVSATTASK